MEISDASELMGGYVDIPHAIEEGYMKGLRVGYAASCSFDARVVDLRMLYGAWRVLVKPVTGAGEIWVKLDGLTVYSVSRATHPRAIRGTIWPVKRSSEELDTMVFSSDTNS